MRRGAVGEDDLATGEARESGIEIRIRLHPCHVDRVDEFEKVGRVDPVHGHQAQERGAVIAEVRLLHPAGLRLLDAKQRGNEQAHPPVHLIEEVAGGRIERVVEIEDPGFRPPEGRIVPITVIQVGALARRHVGTSRCVSSRPRGRPGGHRFGLAVRGPIP